MKHKKLLRFFILTFVVKKSVNSNFPVICMPIINLSCSMKSISRYFFFSCETLNMQSFLWYKMVKIFDFFQQSCIFSNHNLLNLSPFLDGMNFHHLVLLLANRVRKCKRKTESLWVLWMMAPPLKSSVVFSDENYHGSWSYHFFDFWTVIVCFELLFTEKMLQTRPKAWSLWLRRPPELPAYPHAFIPKK